MQTADRVRQILSTRGLSLYQVSQRSAELFGPSSPYYIPQRLYQELATGALSANIHQLIAFQPSYQPSVVRLARSLRISTG